MSCHSCRGRDAARTYSSCSVALPLHGRPCQASCPACPPGQPYGGAACFSSRSVFHCGHGPAGNHHHCRNGRCGGFGYAHSCCGAPLNHHFGHVGGAVAGGLRITSVMCNRALLRPLDLGIDATALEEKSKEKRGLQTLNSKLACFIEKVQLLEQHNLKLKTQWDFVQQRKCQKSHMKPLFKDHVNSLENELKCAEHERDDLQTAHNALEETLQGHKRRFEEEYNRRASAENEYVLLKRDFDCASAHKADLETKIANQVKRFIFLKHIYEQEISELQNCISDTSVLVQMDNRRQLDMGWIIEEFRHQFEHRASGSRAAAEAYFQCQYQTLQTKAAEQDDILKNMKEELQALTHTAHHLQTETATIKAQCHRLEEEVAAAKEHGEMAVKDAKSKLADLEEALHRAKQDMACQLREYQDLMNVRLALGVEIASYRKLLEGEEHWLKKGECAVNISVQECKGAVILKDKWHSGQGWTSSSGSSQRSQGSCEGTRAASGGSGTTRST